MRRWVDKLFTRLQVRYGDAWTRKWEGLPEDAVKADWLEQLGQVMRTRPQAIAHALDNLPAEFPPTVDQFRALCLQARDQDQLRLPKPAWNPEKAREVADAVKAAMKPNGDPLAGARALRERENGGDRTLTPAQRDFWRRALAHEMAAAQRREAA